MAKFKLNEEVIKKENNIRVFDIRTKKYFKIGEIIERTGKRADDFRKSKYFIEIKEKGKKKEIK